MNSMISFLLKAAINNEPLDPGMSGHNYSYKFYVKCKIMNNYKHGNITTVWNVLVTCNTFKVNRM
jgi:hypothetical protein